jgi:hypothetical protein
MCFSKRFQAFKSDSGGCLHPTLSGDGRSI